MLFPRRNHKIYVLGVTRTNSPSLIANQRRDRAIGKQRPRDVSRNGAALKERQWRRVASSRRRKNDDALTRRQLALRPPRLRVSLGEKARSRAATFSHTLSHVCTRFTNLTFTRRLVGSSSHVTLAAPSERAANVVQRWDEFYFRIVVVVSLFCLPLVSPARVADTLVNSNRYQSCLLVSSDVSMIFDRFVLIRTRDDDN